MKNTRYINRQTSIKTGVDEDDVRLITDFYDKKALQFQTGLKGIAYYEEGVGTFFISYPQLRKVIFSIIGKVRKYRKPIYKETSPIRAKAVLDRYEAQLQRLLEIRNELALHKCKLRQYYKDKKANKQRLQNEATSPGGERIPEIAPDDNPQPQADNILGID